MNYHAQIRKLARSKYWQELYNASKELNNISLFNNTTNFSGLQVEFLYWLRVYNMLYTELADKEWPNLDEEVIENDRRCDWFLCYRADQIKKKMHESKNKTKPKSKNSLPVWKGVKGK